MQKAPWCVVNSIMEERLPAWYLWASEARSVKPSRRLTPPELDVEMPFVGLGLSHQ